MEVVLSSLSTLVQPEGAVIVTPDVRTVIWATSTSPLLVPAGVLRMRLVPPAPLSASVADLKVMLPAGGGGGVGVGVGVFVGVGAGVGVFVGVGVGVGDTD